MGLSLNLDSVFKHPLAASWWAALQIMGQGGGGAAGAASGWRAQGAGEEPS
jgi:hypothetical protein